MNARSLYLSAMCAGFGFGCAVEVQPAHDVAGDVEALGLTSPAREPERDLGRVSDTLTVVRPEKPPTHVVACDNPCLMGGPHYGCQDDCSRAMANYDPYCHWVAWDELCVQESVFICGAQCGCTHSLDKPGLAQSVPEQCGCAEIVCRIDYYCCSVSWDSQCADTAKQVCSKW